MNWIKTVVPPRIKDYFSRRPTPDNLWVKCPVSGQIVPRSGVEQNGFVIPGSEHHMALTPRQRLELTFDEGAFETLPLPEVLADPLRFRDSKRYTDRLREARIATGSSDAILVGVGRIGGVEAVVAAQDYHFLVGTLGQAVGGAIVTGLATATARGLPFVLFTASGGARLQEGIFSLMQMPRTIVAVQRQRAARKPYIVVLANPTLGGVSASYAMLGDVQIAEPGAVIGFAGQRVIAQTIRQRLPEGFQRAEFLKAHGMVDMVVHRHAMNSTLARLCGVLTKAPASMAA